jgi:hypothetical protein
MDGSKRRYWVPTTGSRPNTSRLLPMGNLEGWSLSAKASHTERATRNHRSVMCSHHTRHTDSRSLLSSSAESTLFSRWWWSLRTHIMTEKNSLCARIATTCHFVPKILAIKEWVHFFGPLCIDILLTRTIFYYSSRYNLCFVVFFIFSFIMSVLIADDKWGKCTRVSRQDSDRIFETRAICCKVSGTPLAAASRIHCMCRRTCRGWLSRERFPVKKLGWNAILLVAGGLYGVLRADNYEHFGFFKPSFREGRRFEKIRLGARSSRKNLHVCFSLKCSSIEVLNE